MRRRASAYVQYTRASHTTTMKRISRFTTRLSPALSMPKTASTARECNPCSSQEQPPEPVSDGEEDKDHDRHDHRDEPDHREESRLFLVHSVEARRDESPRARSATR